MSHAAGQAGSEAGGEAAGEVVREASPEEIEELVPVLVLAEPSMSALRWSLENLSDAVYGLWDASGRAVGAATMRWRDDPCELVELGVAEDRQGEGIGRRLVAWLLEEARRRARSAMIVGTANASLGNLAFYQKCGFRMDHVRRDYFWYHRTPVVEHGIPVRDMLVFRYDLVESPVRVGQASTRGRRGGR